MPVYLSLVTEKIEKFKSYVKHLHLYLFKTLGKILIAQEGEKI